MVKAIHDLVQHHAKISPTKLGHLELRLLADEALRRAQVERGRAVLTATYPTPEEKWTSLVACLESLGGA